MNKPDLIRFLLEEGLSHKVIALITRSKQPYISKIASFSLHPSILPSPNFDANELRRYNILLRIYELRQLGTQGMTEQDGCYISLLKYCLVDKEKIYELYRDLSKKRFAQAYASKKTDFRKFDASLLDINQEDFNELFLEQVSGSYTDSD